MFNPVPGNPIMAMMHAMRTGQTPMQYIQSMAMRDPRAQQAMQIIQGKSPQQLEQIARNMAREKGVDIDSAIRQFMGG